jgi:nucleoside-diphosphate-sugar epimerase
MRIGETYGQGDYRLLKLFRAAAKGRLLQVGTGDNFHQPIHVDDLSRAFASALDHADSAGHTYILAGAETVTSRQMFEAVAAAIDREPKGIRLPLGPMMLAAITCEKIFGAARLNPPLHRRRLEFFNKNLCFDITKSRSELGFAPRISFADGCRQTAEWYRDKGLLQL